ncbi:helix-turn-helix domain-containing protein [Chryseobacterium sp. c4a]|uniref:helix-turn-helix domain-containing protein n=1 Tax=Chryseobacterium sp. c4a TaxID=1573582 RepID=UPI001356B54E|nr:helix-turn-helix transcriptional regulator [Chryseobacterium sp. c4a]
MNDFKAIAEFYKHKNIEPPSLPSWDTGYFDVIKIDTLQKRGEIISQLSFWRKSIYKIKLIKGKCKCHYAGKTLEIDQYALLFVNPMIPFLLEESENPIHEHFCLFNEVFFSHFGSIKNYPVFQNNRENFFSLTKLQYEEFERILNAMHEELASDYSFKFDAIRNLIFSIIHATLKMKAIPPTIIKNDASHRIAILFEELLAMQFPIHTKTDFIKFKKPKDFAEQLFISINHLNKVIKSTRNKTSSEIITERILQEAKILLKLTDWPIAEIAYLLGYETPSRFTYTFRKNIGIPPLLFRNQP